MKRLLPKIIAVILLVALFCGLQYASYRKGYKKGANNAIERVIFVHDTTTVHDTLTRWKPKYITSTVVDSIPYPVVVHETDTVWAQLPRTEREYGDSTYYAVISGVEPSLDRIDIYQKTQYINNTVYIPQEDSRRDWLELNARFMWDKSLSLPVTLDLGRCYGPLEVYAGGGYDFAQKSLVLEAGGKLKFKF